ncbi:MAG: hypothetical protein B6244_07220 [Candidatus Cloacimonetes bacterium 4572_55]|nr:MAG: hypothetical protein B6244_07220 [Candidatus Cloacimonetes bacterium 4572_55]
MVKKNIRSVPIPDFFGKTTYINNRAYRVIRPPGREEDEEFILGIGGMAYVFMVENDKGEYYALKQLLSHYRETEEIKTYFRREADIASKFSHRHVIKVENFGENQHKDFCIVMEYIRDGYTLKDRLQELYDSNKKMQRVEILHIIRKLCAGLKYIHSEARPGDTVYHRDIKPGNILLDRENEESGFPRVVITDFGISCAEEDGLHDQMIGAGTHGYMAPEQEILFFARTKGRKKQFVKSTKSDSRVDKPKSVKRVENVTKVVISKSDGRKNCTRIFYDPSTDTDIPADTPKNHPPKDSNKIDHRADLYALGVMFHEMVYLEKPSIIDLSRSSLSRTSPISLTLPMKDKTITIPLMERTVTLPFGLFSRKKRQTFVRKGTRSDCKDFDPIIEKLLSQDPDDRYQSADEIEEGLHRLKDKPGSFLGKSIALILLIFSMLLIWRLLISPEIATTPTIHFEQTEAVLPNSTEIYLIQGHISPKLEELEEENFSIRNLINREDNAVVQNLILDNTRADSANFFSISIHTTVGRSEYLLSVESIYGELKKELTVIREGAPDTLQVVVNSPQSSHLAYDGPTQYWIHGSVQHRRDSLRLKEAVLVTTSKNGYQTRNVLGPDGFTVSDKPLTSNFSVSAYIPQESGEYTLTLIFEQISGESITQTISIIRKPPPPPPPENDSVFREDAYRLFKNGEYKKACRIYQKIKQKTEEDLQRWFLYDVGCERSPVSRKIKVKKLINHYAEDDYALEDIIICKFLADENLNIEYTALETLKELLMNPLNLDEATKQKLINLRTCIEKH